MRRSSLKFFSAIAIAGLIFSARSAVAVKSDKAPSFRAEDMAGRTYTRNSFSGKPLVLYFWATWCPACMNDLAGIKKIYQTYHPKGIGFLSVSLDDDPSELKKVLDEKNIRYPVLFDGKGWSGDMVKSFGVKATPTYILLDPDRNVVARGNGSENLSHQLSKL